MRWIDKEERYKDLQLKYKERVAKLRSLDIGTKAYKSLYKTVMRLYNELSLLETAMPLRNYRTN